LNAKSIYVRLSICKAKIKSKITMFPQVEQRNQKLPPQEWIELPCMAMYAISISDHFTFTAIPDMNRGLNGGAKVVKNMNFLS